MIGRRLSPLIVALAALLPAEGLAQQLNLLGTAGLGRRVLPLDARARGMGGAGTALHGGNMAALNPASAIRFNTSGIWATYTPERRTASGQLASGTFDTEDVPLVRLVFPFGDRFAASITAGSYLDQDWGYQFIDTLQLTNADVAFQETRTADGGVTQFRLEMAALVGEGWSLGGGLLVYSGESRRKVSRVFEVGSGFNEYNSNTAINYEGWGLSLGGEVQLIPELILGVAGTWGADLWAANDSTGQGLGVKLPITLDAGASLQLTNSFVLALAAGWEGWSTTAKDLPNATASDTYRFAGGMELALVRTERTQLMFRGGAYTGRLPFEVQSEPVGERALTLGFGLSLIGGRARIETSAEFGSRGSIDRNGVEESFTRIGLGLAVFSR